MLFNEFIKNNPTFWTDNFPTLPSVVTSVIEDWFYYRELCSEKRFNVYFRAKMNVKLDEFLTLYNKELQFRELDPYQIEKIDKTINTIKNNSIKDILESIRSFESTRLETRDVTNLNTKALQDKTTLDLTNTNTKDLTNTETLNTEDNLVKTGTETTANNNTYSNTDTKSGSDTSETANTGTTTTKNTGTTTNVESGTTSAIKKFSDYPQSDLDTLTDYLTNQSNVSENYEKNSSNTDDTQTLVTLNTNVANTTTYNSNIATTGSEEKSQTVTNNLTDRTTKTGTVTNKQTGTDTNAQTGTNTVDKTGTDTNKETGTVNNTDTSNYNLNTTNNKNENGTIDVVLSQLKTGNFLDLYRKYFNVITTFNAVDWLLEELDSCFIQVFDEEDEECCELSSCSDLEKKIEDLQKQVNQLNTRVTDLEEGGTGGGSADINLSKSSLLVVPNITIQDASVPVTFDNQNVFSVVKSGNVIQIFTDSFVLNAQTDVTDTDIINSAINTYFTTTLKNVQFDINDLVQPAAFKKTKLVCSLIVGSVTVYKKLSVMIMFGIINILSVEDATASDMNTNTLIYSYTKEA